MGNHLEQYSKSASCLLATGGGLAYNVSWRRDGTIHGTKRVGSTDRCQENPMGDRSVFDLGDLVIHGGGRHAMDLAFLTHC